jgi:hypothetical protein
MVAYMDKDGLLISKSGWINKRADDSYRTIRQFDNGKVRVLLEWYGKVSTPDSFEDYWELFQLRVFNYLDAGQLVDDPNFRDKFFGTESSGVAAYEDFMLRWTDSLVDEEGNFTESEDNTLEQRQPPPPPVPTDRPSSDAGLIDGGEAW